MNHTSSLFYKRPSIAVGSEMETDLVDDLPEDGPSDVLVLTELSPGEVGLAEPPSDGGQGRPGWTDESHHVGLGRLPVDTNVRHHRGGLQDGLHLAQTDVLPELK